MVRSMTLRRPERILLKFTVREFTLKIQRPNRDFLRMWIKYELCYAFVIDQDVAKRLIVNRNLQRGTLS